MTASPPFKLTPKILTLATEISLLLGRYEGLQAPAPQPKLRKQNQVRTIRDSLAIEGNTLDLEQVTALFEGKRVIGPLQQIREVENAIRLYGMIRELDPLNPKDLLKAHRVLMKDLAKDAGKYRASAVGILKGQVVSHLAPPPRNVAKLMEDLFRFLKQRSEVSPLIRACVFHYEFEFIHPFSDGNGRLGRFWQSLILTSFHPAFEYMPVESVIKDRQADYYRVLARCDRAGDSTEFIEFSLGTIRDALDGFLKDLKPEPQTPDHRLKHALRHFGRKDFSRKDYLQLIKTISTATASRDLALGVSTGRLKQAGARATARYRFH